MWVRGLKYSDALPDALTGQSHPVWVRGLKFALRLFMSQLYQVAPRVGAWIEIYPTKTNGHQVFAVAPRVGAWIEILYQEEMQKCTDVAPRVGAWIEISRH